MSRLTPFDGRTGPDPLGFAATRRPGSASRLQQWPSGFESTARLLAPCTSTPWALAAIGLAATAAVAVWRGADRHPALGIGPAALHLRCTRARPPEAAEPVSVLIPVRHRPVPAVAAIRAALLQRGVDHLDIVVLDDGCPQETRAALRREFADDPRVRLLAAAPLPRGWSPLAHRSHQLAVAARGRVLIFAEPCAPLGPHAAASATALLRREKLDLAVLDTGRPARVPQPAGHDAADQRAQTDGGSQAAASLSPQQRSKGQAAMGRASGNTGRFHAGRFTVAIDADTYWRSGGYRAAATASDPLALLRTVRRASGRVAVADGRSVIPPAQLLERLPPADPAAEALWESRPSARASLTGTARRVLAALVGAGTRT